MRVLGPISPSAPMGWVLSPPASPAVTHRAAALFLLFQKTPSQARLAIAITQA